MASLPLVSDKIIIDSLVLPLTISLDHWSRPQPSPHSLTLTISTPPLTAEASQDDLGSTSINYSTSSKAVVALAQSRSWESLEGCAEAIAACVLEMGGDQGVKSVRVEIGALKVLAGGKARIVISRGRQGEADASPDVMELEGVEVRCIIGLNPQERLEKQSVVVALSIPLPRPSSSSSSAESAPLPPFPHKLFGNAIHEFVGASSYQTIESLAQALCDDLLSLPLPAAYSPLPSITVRVSKPYAITFAKYASVEITRSLGGLQSPAANAPSASSPRREPDISGQGEEHVAYLAMGSNMGDRLGHIKSALKQLDECGSSRVVETSFLYESEPMYVEDQAKFMNGAVKITTTLSPLSLLSLLKSIESSTGRTRTFRNGPRVVDLDILFYDDSVMDCSSPEFEGGLRVPHKSIEEREFVLRPLMDICPNLVHPVLRRSVSSIYASLPPSSPPVLSLYIPFPSVSLPSTTAQPPASSDSPPTPTFAHTPQTLIMSILNLTPDSFSDGSSYPTPSHALSAARDMLANGANILDLGGLSTKPGSEPVSVKDEIARVVPVIKLLREEGRLTCPISIDTYRPEVARAALEAGANCINDVYGGREPGMLEVMAEADVPVILMHSRGTSATMSSLTSYPRHDVVQGVISELSETVRLALAAGVKRYNIVLDPGIGFAKTATQNLELLANLDRIVGLASGSPLEGFPMLVGASRKRFIGELTGQAVPRERGYGSAAVVAGCVESGVVQVVRVHDTRETRDLVVVLEAIKKHKRSS